MFKARRCATALCFIGEAAWQEVEKLKDDFARLIIMNKKKKPKSHAFPAFVACKTLSDPFTPPCGGDPPMTTTPRSLGRKSDPGS